MSNGHQTLSLDNNTQLYRVRSFCIRWKSNLNGAAFCVMLANTECSIVSVRIWKQYQDKSIQFPTDCVPAAFKEAYTLPVWKRPILTPQMWSHIDLFQTCRCSRSCLSDSSLVSFLSNWPRKNYFLISSRHTEPFTLQRPRSWKSWLTFSDR